MLAEFAKRREFVRQRIASIPRSDVPRDGRRVLCVHQHQGPLGPHATAARKSTTRPSGAWRLLEQQNVATVMGSAFGAEGYARISFATSLETLEAGFDRIEAFLRH